MLGKKLMDQAYAVFLATTYAGLITGGVNRRISIRAEIIVFVVSWTMIYFAGLWIRERAELNKKIPVSSKELHRRKKRFYDWLASQGRRQ
jgi:ammonia channel protein AmtB